MQFDNFEERRKHIMKKYSHLFVILEEYDKTRLLPSSKVHLNITLTNKTLGKLKKLSKLSRKSFSSLIEDSFS